MTWNIWMGKFYPEILSVLQQESPDIIALQEVIEPDGADSNTAKKLAETLGYQWVYAYTKPYELDGRSVDWGEAILTRYDIVTSEVLELSRDSRRIALRADIMVHDAVISVYSTHLVGVDDEQTGRTQEAQSAVLARRAKKTHAIICGDFNAEPGSRTIARMQQFLDAGAAQNHPTWCLYPDEGKAPRFDLVRHRYDYVFHTPDVKVSRLNTIRTTGSDHLPVVVRVKVDAGPAGK